MSNLFCDPWPQLRDADGDTPLSGGWLLFFLTGSTTPADVFSNEACTISLGNEILCDSTGRPEQALYLDKTKAYRVIATGADKDTDSPILPIIDPYTPGARTEQLSFTVSGASLTFSATHKGGIVYRTHTSSMSDTLPTPTSAGNGYVVKIKNTSEEQTYTLSVASSGTIDGSSTLSILPGQERELRCNGGSWSTEAAYLTTGKRSHFIPIAAFNATASNGCDDLVRSAGAIGSPVVNFDNRLFDGASNQSAYVEIGLEKSYVPGTMRCRAVWYSAGATIGQNVIWQFRGRCWVDGQAIDAGQGSAASVSDSFEADFRSQTTDWVAMTPNGDAADSMLNIMVTRNASGDTITTDCGLRGVWIEYELGSPNDA